MDNAPIGPGVNDSGEYLALSLTEDQLLIKNAELLDRVTELEAAIFEITMKVHFNYHRVKGVSKPWEECDRALCLEARKVLGVLGEVKGCLNTPLPEDTSD